MIAPVRRVLPPVRAGGVGAEGGVVAVPDVGAYGPTASLVGLLSRPAPAEVLVDGGTVVSATRMELRRSALLEGELSGRAMAGRLLLS